MEKKAVFCFHAALCFFSQMFDHDPVSADVGEALPDWCPTRTMGPLVFPVLLVLLSTEFLIPSIV